MRVAVCLFAAIACGGSGAPHAVRASVRDGSVEVFWDAAPTISASRVQLADLDRGVAVSEPVLVRGAHALLPGVASGVWVDAQGRRTTALVGAGAAGGNGSDWQIFAPWDFRRGALEARFDRLTAGERIGVLLVNFGGRDEATAEVSIDGVGDPEPTVARAALTSPRPAPLLHEAMRERESALALEQPAAAETLAPGAPRSFCVVSGLDFSHHRRKPATLAVTTAHADVYVDDDDLGAYEGPDLQTLAQAFEEQVWPPVTSTFGAPTDVDGNGKLLVLLTHELGAHLNGGWLIGYFGNADLVQARDDSAACSGTGSNHGEIVYLNDARNGVENGYARADLFSSVYPATLAHEMQHLLNFARRCVLHRCDGPEAVWINEALSKVAEDLAGYGWNGPGGRAEGTAYLGHGEGDLRGYDGRSLTQWEGDPIGNYQGAHSFLRLFADRRGADLPGRVAASPGGVAGLEAVLGLPMPMAMAQWATALLLSNEDGAPYSFSGTAWSPLHDRLRHLETRPPGAQALRADGIAAVMSGSGLDGPARVVVRSAEENPPYVVVVRTRASFPAR
ncbi:MAG TPA: hypothetical protein VFA79_10430 [Myxococcales bacterium]|nr:hypothetical protein [Myxococcales bacterium]